MDIKSLASHVLQQSHTSEEDEAKNLAMRQYETASRDPVQDSPHGVMIEFPAAPAARLTGPVLEVCTHCQGSYLCTCPTCTLWRSADPKPCCMCQSREHEVFVARTTPKACWHCNEAQACSCIV